MFTTYKPRHAKGQVQTPAESWGPPKRPPAGPGWGPVSPPPPSPFQPTLQPQDEPTDPGAFWYPPPIPDQSQAQAQPTVPVPVKRLTRIQAMLLATGLVVAGIVAGMIGIVILALVLT